MYLHSRFYNPAQKITIDTVTLWASNRSNTTNKPITTLAVEPDFRYPDELFYIHLLSEKYVDLIKKASTARVATTSHPEKWDLLVNAFSRGKDDFSGWERDVFSSLEFKRMLGWFFF